MAAATHFYKGGAWRTATKWQRYLSSTAAWVEIKRAAVYNGSTGSWHDFYVKGGYTPTPTPSPTPTPTPVPVNLDVKASPTSIAGSHHGSGLCVTNASVITAFNGVPPYNYAFSNGNYTGPNPPSIVTETANKAHMTKNLVVGGRPLLETGELKCLVTDSVGNVGTISVKASFVGY